MTEIVRAEDKGHCCLSVNQKVEIITCQCQYMCTDERTGEKAELTFRFVVPDGEKWFTEADRIADRLGYTIDHAVGTYFLHKTWVDASDLYVKGEQTFR